MGCIVLSFFRIKIPQPKGFVIFGILTQYVVNSLYFEACNIIGRLCFETHLLNRQRLYYLYVSYNKCYAIQIQLEWRRNKPEISTGNFPAKLQFCLVT